MSEDPGWSEDRPVCLNTVCSLVGDEDLQHLSKQTFAVGPLTEYNIALHLRIWEDRLVTTVTKQPDDFQEIVLGNLQKSGSAQRYVTSPSSRLLIRPIFHLIDICLIDNDQLAIPV